MPRSTLEKLAILADAAKYDASCASSGAPKRNSRKGGIGSTTGNGICHSYTPDGRCVSLLKILLTNFCIYDCAYCINRRSSDVERARFTVDEVVRLTLDFYTRNYIEGLFLSSGIIRSADDTMNELIRVARTLRVEHGFRGYIHLKTIPDASEELIAEAGRWADRLSLNIELPTEKGLAELAPEKTTVGIKQGMAAVKSRIDEAATERRAPRFAPAGQSTQMIVGADGASDLDIMRTSATLTGSYGLKRVYYSAFSPIQNASARLPLAAPPLLREHRLYQADWLLRFYGFALEELDDAATPDGMFQLGMDPKLAWAMRNRHLFPLDINTAPREMLLRVPGLGVRSVDRIVASRRHGRLRHGDLARLARSMRAITPFVLTDDHRPQGLDSTKLQARVAPKAEQLALL